MIRINRILFVLLLLLPLAFTSCEGEPAKIDITLESDYSGLLAAIRGVDRSVSDKLALIETAVSSGLADNQTAMKLARDLIASIEGTTAEKMAAIETAMKAQSASLETKMTLVEAAVTDGFADSQAQQKLLQAAVASLGGTMAEKLAAIEAAVKAQTTSLETKLGVIEAAVAKGFADSTTAQALIVEAIDAMGKTLEEKFAAVEAAVASQTAGLASKMALIETALNEGFAAESTQQTLIRKAVESLGGSMDEKLSAIETAVKDGTTSLESKLALVEAAVRNGAASREQVLALIRQAIESVDKSTGSQLASIEAAMKSRTPSLEAKLDLIATALKEGFLADSTAVRAMQDALESSLGNLNDDLSDAKEAVKKQLDTVAKRLSTEELAKAFQGIREAIDSQSQSAGTVLAAIQQTLAEILQDTGGSGGALKGLVYMGDLTKPVTVSVGQYIKIRLRVNPSTVKLTENMLQIDQQDRKQFFLSGADRSQAVKNHFPSFTLQEDPGEEGQYIVSIRTLVDETYKYWDETSLVFKCRTTDKDGNPQYVSTQPVPVVIMPNPKDGLSVSGRENTASFLINDTLGIIYQPLVSIVFRDGSDTRTYTADFLQSARFDPTSQLKVTTILDREKHFVGIQPDTTNIEPGDGWRRWDDPDPRYYGTLLLRDSTRINHQELLGSLELTDRWGGTYSAPLSHSLAWYTSYADTVLADPTISGDGKLQANLASKATALGLNLGEHPGSTYCDVSFDFASASGAWLSAQFKPYSWDLEMQLMTYPKGARFTVDAVITQTVQPNENDSSFRPKQRKARIRVTFTIK